ncbi:MAG TPA: terminase family protein [Verrucomicrobiae bacterium]|nr:terminase family protein [Verrucomicrobiae bacterium]
MELELQRLRNRGREGSAQRVRIALRPYQDEVFKDRSSGILILHWSRQIGKSFTLAAWAVDRLLSRPGRLVTVLSNSRENGAEFVAKCAEVCHLNGTEYESVDKSQGVRFQNMRMEVRIRANGKVGRIKVLAANPRTARGFSGDLILDEFAFHEDSAAIWEAAEPILASNPDFLCRMASTGNGRHNLFYRMTCGQARGAGCEADREEGDDNREFTQINAKAGAGPAGSRPIAVATPLRKSVSVPSDSRFRALRELRRMGWV